MAWMEIWIEEDIICCVGWHFGKPNGWVYIRSLGWVALD